ncbi:protoporphyrinogen oxidase, partial [Candidatus Desantisbacteria bacterium]|nr:protoporphyrinogen oxidase [Candidatus Desantisbacteria bacterium]
MKKIVIIGGGISGLSTAYFILKKLKEKNETAEITLIEKNSTLGGNISTYSHNGFIIEGGPDCFISDKPSAINLCEELGLSDNLITTKEENKGTFILNKGRLILLPEGLMFMVPTKITPFLSSPLISFPGKIRMGMDLFIPRRKDNSDESLGNFVRRRLGQEALDKIAEPLIAGIHAGDPEKMSVKSTFPRFVDMEKKYRSLIRGMLAKKHHAAETKDHNSGKHKKTLFMSLKGGLIELPNKIRDKINPFTRIILNTKVLSINKIHISENEQKYEIKMNNNETIIADNIILTNPAYEAAKLIKDFAPILSSLLNDFSYTSTITISVGFNRSDIKHDLHGHGFIIPKTEKRKIMGTTWTSEKFPYRAPSGYVLLRGFIGELRNPEVIKLPEGQILEIILKEWHDIMGIEAKPVIHKTYHWNKVMPQYILGHENTLSKMENMVASHKG